VGLGSELGDCALADEPSDVPPQDPRAPELDVEQLRRDLTRAVARACPPWLADQAEDIVHGSLIRLLEIARRSEGKVQLSSSYLGKAAYTAVVDVIRLHRRRREVPLQPSGADVELAAAVPDPEQGLRAREAGKAIQDCLQRLVRPRQMAVTLHLGGNSVAEIGRTLGWKEKRAENLVYRGLADLRSCLDGKGIRP
jgi:RNA polymerase sigma-70 factor, ECF subfamily